MSVVRRIFHIDLDAFFVSVEQALDPNLRGKPVVVGGRPDRRGVVASASYEARKFGIRAGMPLIKAYRLCPQAIFVQGSFSRYQEASEKFMGILANFSPHLEPIGLDEAYLDATGSEGIFGSACQLALKIKERIKEELKLTASIGIARCKVVAKIASDLCKPDGLLEVAPGEECLFLAPLPVAQLPGVGRKTEQGLKEIGVTTIGQLAKTSPDFLRQRLGAPGVALYRYANAIDDRKVEPAGETKSMSRETTFAEDTLDQSFLEATLRYLCERVGAELRSRGKQARCVTLKLRYADFKTISRSFTLKETTDSDEFIFTTALQLLYKALNWRRKLVRLLGIEVSHLSEGKQLSLLNSSVERLAHLDRTIDRIRRKYGFTSIQIGRTLSLKEVFTTEKGDYVLGTPSLSR